MSDIFDFSGFPKALPDWAVRKRILPSFELPAWYRHTDADDAHDGTNVTPRRHRQSGGGIPDIVIRRVHNITDDKMTTGARGYLAAPTADRVARARAYVGKHRTSSYWQDAGWEKRDNHLIGHYWAGPRPFTGAIELKDSVVEPAVYFIYDPPDELLRGAHGNCYWLRGEVSGKRKYMVHFSEGPPDVDSGIIQIQRNLAAALGVW